jgi:hypothetical protein
VIAPEKHAKLGTPIQYANWGMSPAELEASGGSHIVKASISQTFPNDRPLNGRRGSVLDVNADEVFSSSSNLIEGISFLAYYYFDARGLFLIALVPPSIDEGIKTERLLEAKYGSPEREQRMGREEGASGCIIRRRWRTDSNLITFFNQCGDHFEVRYQPIPAKGGL